MKLNKEQLILLGNICKKDGMTGSSSGELDEMVRNGLLTKQTDRSAMSSTIPPYTGKQSTEKTINKKCDIPSRSVTDRDGDLKTILLTLKKA